MYLYNTQYNILYYHGCLYIPVLYTSGALCCVPRTTTTPPLTLTVGIELLLYDCMDRVRYLNS